jgi:hypothetical protein
MSNLRKKLIRLAHQNPGKVRNAILPLLKTSNADSDLTKYAIRAYDMLSRPSDSPFEKAQSVAYAVGGYAARKGMTEIEIRKWLQNAYGRVWVMKGNLDPGMDLKEVSKAILKTYRRTIRAQGLKGVSTM